jgi:hypothetical protein
MVHVHKSQFSTPKKKQKMFKFTIGFVAGVYASQEYPNVFQPSMNKVLDDLQPVIQTSKTVFDNALHGKYTTFTDQQKDPNDNKSNNKPKP